MNDKIGTTDISALGTTLTGAIRWAGYRSLDLGNTNVSDAHFQYAYGFQGRTYEGPNLYDTILAFGGFGSNIFVIVCLFNGATTPVTTALVGNADWVTASVVGNKPRITFSNWANGMYISARGFVYSQVS